MPPWYDRAFGPWYLKLYPHRDREEAERAVSALLPFLPASGALLDAGCGSGRHAEALVERGFHVTGLDRSRVLLAEAGCHRSIGGRLVRGDMRRLPFRSGSFSAVLSMFTSFGYFDDAGAHSRLLAEYARVTRPAGLLVLDYVNAERVRASLEEESTRWVDGHQVRERRRIEREGPDDRVVKEVEITAETGAVVERYHESVALYDPPRLLEMLAAAGWRERARLGDYGGGAWHADAERFIVIGERGGPR
jgi:SAM-dependent methyltransferase